LISLHITILPFINWTLKHRSELHDISGSEF